MPKRLLEHLERLKEARRQLANQIKESEAALKKLDAEIEDLQNSLKEEGIELQLQSDSN
jgi:septal ring factor EnvC (AmiA/AmiB activator)